MVCRAEQSASPSTRNNQAGCPQLASAAGAKQICQQGAWPVVSVFYKAFGMQIRSEIRLLLPAGDTTEPASDCAPDTAPWPVDIIRGTIPTDSVLPHAIGNIRYGMCAAGCAGGAWIRVHVPRVARYQIQGVSRIIVAPEAGADERLIGLYISGLILAFLLKQLPVITLHGSAVVKEGNALAFIGNQGSGKSTTAAAMTTAGYRVLCDDIIPIADGPVVLPGVAQVKLLPDAFERLAGNPDDAGHLFDGVDKFQADLGGTTRSAPLRAIFVLEPDSGQDPAAREIQVIRDARRNSGLPLVEPIMGMQKIRTLMQHVCGIKALDDELKQFSRLTRRLGPVPVFRLARRRQDCDIPVVISQIITHAMEGENVW